ncbi:inactive serine protease 54 isoform X3 [Pelodiscus sinensis]|uniref:inactive serine protease 54 isoform X3 n=1 Tax=Pelodiscus sinensis TaxID=13735 RepID=UPI003F6D7BBA
MLAAGESGGWTGLGGSLFHAGQLGLMLACGKDNPRILGSRTRGLVLLCLCMSHSPAAGCGSQVSLAPSRATQEFAAVGEFPWVASIQDLQHNHLAFGSILSENWILSAAATFQTRRPAVAVVGITDLNAQSGLLPRYSISSVIPHEDFNEITLDRNLALLRTATPVRFTAGVQPICFPGRNLTAAALENCWVAGWLHPTAARKPRGSRLSQEALRRGRGAVPLEENRHDRVQQPPGLRLRHRVLGKEQIQTQGANYMGTLTLKSRWPLSHHTTPAAPISSCIVHEIPDLHHPRVLVSTRHVLPSVLRLGHTTSTGLWLGKRSCTP